MAVDPGTIIKGIGLITSLFGSRMSPAQRMQLQILRQKYELMARAGAMAKNYNPDAETEIAVDFAQKKSARQLENVMAQLNQRYKVMGGSPTGDTNFVVRQQRAQDDILNPLAEWMANRKAQAFALKMQALQSAAGMGGDLFGGYGQIAGYEQGANQAMYQNMAGLLEDLIPNRRPGGAGVTQSDDVVNAAIGRGKKKDPYAEY